MTDEQWEPSRRAVTEAVRVYWANAGSTNASMAWSPGSADSLMRAALKAAYVTDHPRRCEAHLVHGSTGTKVSLSTGRRFAADTPSVWGDGRYAEVTTIRCGLPIDHDGPHVPDVPDTCWRSDD